MLAEGKNATIILIGAGIVFLVLMGSLLLAGLQEADYRGAPVNTSTAPVGGTMTPSDATGSPAVTPQVTGSPQLTATP
jgi:hypothetical protein